jgi:hypothetical protein
VRYFALAAMANGILDTSNTWGGALPGGGLRRALPAPQRNAQEPASSRREGHGHVVRRVAQSDQKKSVMSDLEERLPRVGVKRTLARWNQGLQKIHSPILGYGLSVVCVAIALGLALTLQYYQFRDAALPHEELVKPA